MISSSPTLFHRFEYVSLGLGSLLMRCVPRRAHAACSRLLARYWFHICPIRRGVVLENLTLAFPDKSEKWRRETAMASMAHFIRMAFEFTSMKTASDEQFALVKKIEGKDHFDAIGAGTKPFIFVAGHLGNWELGISYGIAKLGLKVSALAKPMHNPLVEAQIAKVREARGYKVIYTTTDLRQIFKAVQENRVLAFLADQDARKHGIFVPFFGKEASTFQGPALFAHRLNLPIICGLCLRSGDGNYVARFLPPLYPNPTAPRDEEIARLTLAHVQMLEQAIRENPEQYFWFHKRWKTKRKKNR